MTWREALLEGNLSEAKTLYLASDDEDALGSYFWQDLESLQKHLRAKHWQRAYNVVEDFELDDTSIGIIDKDNLMAELAILKESSVFLDRRRPEEALASLESVTQPLLLAEKMCQQGTAHIFLNETETAKMLFTGGLELDQRHYRILTNLGNLYLESNELDTAITHYEKALAIKEDFGNAMHNLGVAYRQKGQISKSVGLIKKAQSNLRKAEAEDARGSLSSSISGPFKALTGGNGKLLRYGFYALALVIVLFILRSRGVI